MEVNFTWMWQYILSFCPPWQWTNKKCKFCVFSKDPFVVEKYSIHWAQLTLGYFRTVWLISGNPCKDPSPCRKVFFLESLLFTERPDKDPDSVYFFPHQLHLIFFVNTSGFCSIKSSFCCQPTRKNLSVCITSCKVLLRVLAPGDYYQHDGEQKFSPSPSFCSFPCHVRHGLRVADVCVGLHKHCHWVRGHLGFWLLPTGKNLYFQQIVFRIATHLTRWAPVLAGMFWRHRCDRQRGTHRTGGQRWHNNLRIKIILTGPRPTLT